MRRAVIHALLLLLATGAGASEELFEAVRLADLEAVKSLVEAGADVDSADRYGTTVLSKAAAGGHLEIVRYLLDRGADIDREDEFYGSSAFDMAFFQGRMEVASLLLERGASRREMALSIAMQRDDLELAKVAIAAGPLAKTQLAMLREHGGGMSAEWQELLSEATEGPDPPLPEYAIEELHRFTGIFEGWATDLRVEVSLREGVLVMRANEDPPRELEVIGDRTFQSADGALGTFFGRAGTIEGFNVRLGEGPPQALRRSVAEPVAGAGGAVAAREATAAQRTVNWPAFRGANAAGVGDGEDALTSWDLESGEGVLWNAAVGGLGNSSPVVWGDRVFVTTAVAEGVEQGIRTGLTGAGDGVDEAVHHSWRLLALDKETGDVVWDREVGGGVPTTKRHFKATQANSTPVTDGRHLVVVFPDAGLACFDLDGNLLWKHELGGLPAGAFTDAGIEWGFASSPVIYKDTVILQADTHGGGFLAAWELASGKELWRTPRDVAPSWATPALLEGPDGTELVVNGSTIHGYDPDSGEELWSLGPNSELVIAAPVVGDGVVYVSAGYPPVKPIYALRAGTRGAIEAEPGKEHERLAWSHRIGGAYMPTPLLYRGLYYVVHHNGRIVAYDAESGDAVYKSRFSRGGVFTGSPVAVNGKLYLPTEEGLLYVLAAGPEYEELAVNEHGEPLMATPAVSEGVLFLRTPTRLIAVGAG